MKKVLALALTLVMVLGMFAVVSFAAETDIVVLGTTTAGKTGDTVTLKVETTKVGTPFGGFDVIINYDPEVVAPVLTNDALEGDDALYESTLGLINVNLSTKDINMDYGNAGNAIKVLGTDGKKTQKEASQLITLQFKVLKDYTDAKVPFTFGDISFLDGTAAPITTTSSVNLLKADTAALVAAIAEAGKVDKTLYTAESYAALEAAVKAGEALVAETDPANQSKIDDAATAIKAAIKALETPAQKEIKDAVKGLEDVMAKADKFDATGFSKDQLARLEAAKKAAAEAAKSGDLEKIAAAKAALEAVMKETPDNPGTSDMNVAVFAVLATLSLVAAGFVVAKKRKA